MAYPPNSDDLTEAKTTIANILKMEGYKLDSGSLFLAFKDAGGEMSQFAPSLEELQEENVIKSDSEGNIMTVEDYQREQSQQSEEESNEEIVEDTNEETKEDTLGDDVGDLESIIKLKKETDSWLIEQLKNNGNDEELRAEVKELEKRVSKLEKIIKNLTRAFD